MRLTRKMKDLTGRRFGRLVAIKPVGKRGRNVLWECVCDCGTERSFAQADLSRGSSTSCGCYQRECATAILTKHGMHGTGAYKSWRSMRKRCYRKNTPGFQNYGGSGVAVCDRWRNSFENFYKDMGPRPRGTTLDRIDNSRGYSRENCRWSTPQQQTLNRSTTRYIRHGGKVKCVTDWSRELGGCDSLVHARLRKGWSERAAVATPLKKGAEGRQ